MRIKIISLWQPWASLMAIGAKGVETRSWATSYRGPIGIHAAKKWNQDLAWGCDDPDFARALKSADLWPPGVKLPRGALISVGNLIDCHPTNKWQPPESEEPFGDYGPNRFGWQVNDMQQLAEPLPMRGQQGLWEWEAPAWFEKQYLT